MNTVGLLDRFKPKPISSADQEIKELKRKAENKYKLAFAQEEADIAAEEGRKAARAKYKDQTYKPKPKKSFMDSLQEVAGQAKELEKRVGGQFDDYTGKQKGKGKKPTEVTSKDPFGF